MYTGVRPDDTAILILKNGVQELGWKAASELLLWRRSSSKISPQSQGKPSAQVSQQYIWLSRTMGAPIISTPQPSQNRTPSISAISPSPFFYRNGFAALW
jgi:hypothetical protein